MDKAIVCKCGSISWIIGEGGTRCAKCFYYLPLGAVIANVAEINEAIEQLKK